MNLLSGAAESVAKFTPTRFYFDHLEASDRRIFPAPE
jgi:hypothetical protein